MRCMAWIAAACNNTLRSLPNCNMQAHCSARHSVASAAAVPTALSLVGKLLTWTLAAYVHAVALDRVSSTSRRSATLSRPSPSQMCGCSACNTTKHQHQTVTRQNQ